MKIAVSATIGLLIISAIAYYEFKNVVVLDGHYELPVTLTNFDAKTVSGVTYATIDSHVVQIVIDNYPSSEPAFHPISNLGVTLLVSITRYASAILKREWGHTKTFETVLFRIEYKDPPAEFRAIEVPERNSEASNNLTL